MLFLQPILLFGFPGETEQEFETTYQFLKEIRFYKIHVFPYSARKGTKAASMPNQVETKKKEERSKKIIALSEQYEKEFLDKMIGKKIEVLFEQQEEIWLKGHTTNYLEVKVKKAEAEANENEMKTVHIKNREDLSLIGTTM